MPTVDSLDIQISAQANNAIASLDKLSGKLNILYSSLNKINGSGLTGFANSVNKLTTSMQSMKSVGTADFTRLAKNVEKLGNLNVTNLNSAASSMSHLTRAFNQLGGVSANAQQVGSLASNLSKLGYKSVSNAITNLPLLTSELNNLMTTLSRAPQVSNNVIQMTNALANLASQGGRVGTASRTLVNGLNNSTTAMNRASKSSTSLAAAFGKFYATWFLAIRGIKKLWGSAKSSMDYVETLNYFDKAFDQVAQKADLSSFEELGYKSAEEYAKSFSERAKQLTEQMTGFAVTDKGTLEATGMPSLGIDPSQLMQYQAMFGQMASSMGVASETSLKLSRALTEIGADLASVKNMDFDKVWTDMASALAGMSRTVDKYGANIRNVNLQQKLTELGINANIQALNQNDKALLRTIILLDSTRYAWGDMAETINQPANQLRLINANFQNLGRTIGNLFLPIIQKVLPYINALVIALQRLFTWIGSLLGIDLSKVTSSIGDTDFSGLVGDTEDLTDGLNGAAKAAEKLKKGIRGFDELKVIETKDDSGSGAGAGAGISSGLLDAAFEDALSEYQKVWDEAFANMENRAQEMADKIEKMFKPIKDIIQDFVEGDFFKAGQDVSKLWASIYNFFARAIEKVDWRKIGINIGDFLAGIDWTTVLGSIGELIWNAINAAMDLWSGTFAAAPIETAIITGILALKWTGLDNAITGKLKPIIYRALLNATNIGSEGKNITSNIVALFTKDLAYVFKHGSYAAIGTTVAGGIAGSLVSAWAGYNIGLSIREIDIGGKTVGEYVDGFVETWFTGFSVIKDTAEEIWNNIVSFFATSIPNWWNNTVAPWFTKERWMNLFNNIYLSLQTKWNSLIGWWNNTAIVRWWNSLKSNFSLSNFNKVFESIPQALTSAWTNAVEGIKQIWNNFAGWLNSKLTWDIQPISIAGKQIFAGATIDLGRIPTFEYGGFPEDGWFRASKGEYFGQFDDGTSYIANNNQIETGIAAGIEEAAYRGFMRAMSETGGANANVTFQVEGDPNNIFKVTQVEAKNYTKRTGRPAYTF